jgi:hypothetical protein
MEFYCWSGGQFVWLMANGEVGGPEDLKDALADVSSRINQRNRADLDDGG